MPRIRDIDDQRAVRVAHVADIRDLPLHHDLSAARAVVPRERLETASVDRLPAHGSALPGVNVCDFPYAFGAAHCGVPPR